MKKSFHQTGIKPGAGEESFKNHQNAVRNNCAEDINWLHVGEECVSEWRVKS